MTTWNVARLAGILAFALIATACSTLTPADGRAKQLTRDFYWSEEVQISNGQVMLVKRGETRVRAGEPGRGAGWLFDTGWIEVEITDVGKVRWEGALSPLVLDFTNSGEWYLLGIVGSWRGWKNYGLPEHKSYVAFVLRGARWERIPFDTFPKAFTPNLLASRGQLFLVEEAQNGILVDLAMKRRLDSRPTLGEEFRSIDPSKGQ